TAHENVRAGPAGDCVVSGTAIEVVVAGEAEQAVVPGQAVQLVPLRGAAKGVVAPGAVYVPCPHRRDDRAEDEDGTEGDGDAPHFLLPPVLVTSCDDRICMDAATFCAADNTAVTRHSSLPA